MVTKSAKASILRRRESEDRKEKRKRREEKGWVSCLCEFVVFGSLTLLRKKNMRQQQRSEKK
jgi:hypothetical protein